MKINRIHIKNYRNLKDVSVQLQEIVTVIGENNSGKSNFLKAVTFPFLADEIGYAGKTLVWTDINNEAKDKYFSYILSNKEKIVKDEVDQDVLAINLPIVSVEVQLIPNDKEFYWVKDLSYGTDEYGNLKYGILYEYRPKNIDKVYEHIKQVLCSEEINDENINKVKMNLLPIELYSHSISVPKKGTSVSYDILKLFRYTALIAERDGFSSSQERLGSKLLVKILQAKLDTDAKLKVETEYSHFFETLKSLGDMDNIINWQDNTGIKNAKDFFENITILPNMPPMNSILNSVSLGYSGESLSSQGLGYRNLILLLVLMNSLTEKKEEIAFNVLTVEEPEAHLCINNTQLMVSFIKALAVNNDFIQMFYSTHSTEFVNKLDFKNIIIMNNGTACALSEELDEEGMNYLAKNPNLDLFKFFFSRKCILVEGLTEELLIRAYLDSKKELNDIEVISFHKGYKNIIDIWLKINSLSKNKLGIIRDYDNQDNAKKEHEKYNQNENVFVATTSEYTLEPEIVKTNNNYNVLSSYFKRRFGWSHMSQEELSDKWREAKADVMLTLCKDLSCGELQNFMMPNHIQSVINFLNDKNEETGNGN